MLRLSKDLTNLFVTLCVLFILAPRPMSGQIAYDGPILDRANRWDGYPAHLFFGGKHHIWWCSEGSNYTDVIYYASKSGSLGPGGWTTPIQVLGSSQVPWAGHHICDPSVIRGSFAYNGTNYSYALYFTADTGSAGGNNSIGVAFSNDGTFWKAYSAAVVTPTGNSASYGAGMSGVAFHPTTGKLMHAYLDTSYSPILRLSESTNGVNFSPNPPWATQLQAAGRQGNDGQGPDIAFHPGDGHWYAAIKNYDPQGIYDGETRVLRAVNPDDLLGAWEVIGVFNSVVTGQPQNHNPGLGKNEDGSLYVDAQGWAYVFFSVGAERPDTRTWQVAQGRFRPSFRLSVGKTGNGDGTVTTNPVGISCGTDCYEDYAAGSTVTLTTAAGVNSKFIEWTGDPDCADGQVVMTANRSCYARFDLKIWSKVTWIQPQPLAGFGPLGSLIIAGKAAGAPAGTLVDLYWRNVSLGGAWVHESYRPLPDENNAWYHSIPNATYTQKYDVYIIYYGVTSATCTYAGLNDLTWCP